MDARDDFFKVVTPENLYFAASIFGAITIFSVCVIYYILYQKKKQNKDFKAIEALLDQWISEALIEDSEHFTHKYIISDLFDYFYKKQYRQYIIDRLIKSQISLKGNAAANIINLYHQLDLQHDSAQKFHSSKWEIKARGVYELCMMEQSQFKDEIAKETNNRNEYIRMEAQIASIVFEGFDGLKFMDSLTRPLTEWQQLKILDQLQVATFQPMDNINSWLNSENSYVRLFAMRLAEIYQQYQCHDVIVAIVETSENAKIRTQGVRSLGKLALPGTALFLKEQYVRADNHIKHEILKAIGGIGDSENLPFLEEVVKDKDVNVSIKLEATRSMFLSTKDQGALAEVLMQNNNLPETIVKQVLYENSL